MENGALLAAAGELRSWLTGVRRQLHMQPELGLEEVATADAIVRWLDELGIANERKNTAVIGLIQGANPGKTVALRADMDALPIREEGAVEYRSRKDGVMHACGHDAHMTIQLGAARLLAGLRGELNGQVKLLFQPAEETDGGAQTMIRDGCLEHPHVDRIYGLHVMPYLPAGFVELKKGVLCGSSATLSIRVHGKSAHGAYPETGVDAVLVAATIVTALNTLVSRCVSSAEQAVLSVGTIHGGTASNILAGLVEMRATLRTTSAEVRETLIGRIREVVEGTPRIFGGSGELEVSYGYEALVNHDEAVNEIEAVAKGLLGPDRITWKEQPGLGVEDFSFLVRERVGAFYHLGCGNAERGITAPLHSSTFNIDEECLVFGAAMQAGLALRYLMKGGGA